MDRLSKWRWTTKTKSGSACNTEKKKKRIQRFSAYLKPSPMKATYQFDGTLVAEITRRLRAVEEMEVDDDEDDELWGEDILEGHSNPNAVTLAEQNNYADQ